MTGAPPIALRAAAASDYDFARILHHAGMRWIGERLAGGWDDAAQDQKFASQFVSSEVRIIVLGDRDVGYLQLADEADALFLKDLHVLAPFQNRGIGTAALRMLFAEAGRAGKAMTVGVVKFNPARALYARLGFRLVREDEHKLHLRRDCSVAARDN
jgi:ribosomal protein S18 acetylase RimI-like enzyme